jgi:hypothetical protein
LRTSVGKVIDASSKTRGIVLDTLTHFINGLRTGVGKVIDALVKRIVLFSTVCESF